MKKWNKTADTFLANLEMLLKETGIKKIELAKKSGVSLRMIGFILTKDRVPSIETAEKIGKAFGLSGWLMLKPNLKYDIVKNKQFQKLIETYSNSSAEGRKYINMVAERESKYSK